MSNSQARVEDIFAEAARLFENKNRNYGDSWRNQGWRGNVSRILEKAARVRTMVWRGGNVLLNSSSEHPRETMLDMINTLAFAIINMDDDVEWGNESQAKEIKPPLNDMPEWARGGVPGSYEEALERRAAGAQQNSEQTIVASHVGELPPPGEEKPSPNPRKRQAKVTDRGSAPRPIADIPQA